MNFCNGCIGRDKCREARCCRYPYRNLGPAVHGSKLADYLISEAALRDDQPELFKANKESRNDAG